MVVVADRDYEEDVAGVAAFEEPEPEEESDEPEPDVPEPDVLDPEDPEPEDPEPEPALPPAASDAPEPLARESVR
jgi:hypothetical protein